MELPDLTWYKVNTFEGLNLACGQACPDHGNVIVQGPRGLKRYIFRRRKGDGHYITRWGRLSGATVCRDNTENGRVVSIIFDIEPR